jgi:error-prone DNA polymerase
MPAAPSASRGASNQKTWHRGTLDLPALALRPRWTPQAPRLHSAAKTRRRAIVGAELTLETNASFQFWSPIESVIKTFVAHPQAKLRGTKTESTVLWKELPAYAEGLLVLTGDEEGILRNPCQQEDLEKLETLATIFGRNNVFVEIQRHLRREEAWRNKHLVKLAGARRLPLVATNGVLYAEPGARCALDLFTCARHHTHLDCAGRLLSINAERHLKSADQIERLFSDLPEAVENTARVAERIEFTLENLGYEFPKYPVPPGETMDSFLRTVASERRGGEMPISAQRC